MNKYLEKIAGLKDVLSKVTGKASKTIKKPVANSTAVKESLSNSFKHAAKIPGKWVDTGKF